MERLLALIAIALAAFTSNAFPFQHACSDADFRSESGLGTGYRLDSSVQITSDGRRYSREFRYDENEQPVSVVSTYNDEIEYSTLELRGYVLTESHDSGRRVSTYYYNDRFLLDSVFSENKINNTRSKNRTVYRSGDTVFWEAPNDSIQGVWIYEDGGKREYIISDTSWVFFSHLSAIGDSCKRFIINPNGVGDLLPADIEIVRNGLLQKRLFSAFSTEALYYYHPVKPLSLMETVRKRHAAHLIERYRIDGRRANPHHIQNEPAPAWSKHRK